jgi:PhnB protein
MAILNPYLNFHGNAREAMEFYRDVFGGELTINTYGDFGNPDESQADKVMHSHLKTSMGFDLMGADVPGGEGEAKVSGMNIVVSGDEEDELRGYWEKLSEGATISMALEKQMWGDIYGDLTDRFGTPWAIDIGTDEGA